MTRQAPRIRVLLADDHPVVREGIRSCLAVHTRVRIIGEAVDGDQAVALARTLKPDVILMDINMPGRNGMEATEAIRRESPGAKVLALTVHTHREYVRRIIQSGARGYVLKDAAPAELVRAIEAVAEGHAYFSPAIAHFLAEDASRPGGERAVGPGRLSGRERQVLALIAEGLTNKEMSTRLAISVRTVETHRESLMRKLQVFTAAGLTRYAIASGVVSLE